LQGWQNYFTDIPEICMRQKYYRIPIFAPTWSASGTSKLQYQQIAEKCFSNHRMGDGQMFMIFSATTALSKAYQFILLSTPVNFRWTIPLNITKYLPRPPSETCLVYQQYIEQELGVFVCVKIICL
jgi:hypothetical protein